MLNRNIKKSREQVQLVSIDELVPKEHLLRDIERSIDFSFIYEIVADKYSANQGRPSLDPVMLIKIPMIQYLFGIKSMRQTIKDIEVNVAYRWFLGLDLYDKVPHFSTFGKNYSRRFKDSDLFEQIFSRILKECMDCGFVDSSAVFMDATHIKANANIHKLKKTKVELEALFYEEELKKEIDLDREKQGKKPLKDRDDKDNDDFGGGSSTTKEITASQTDEECGLFHKGEHKKVFAYSSQTICDRYGWILGYSIHRGNEHDSRTFPEIYEKAKEFKPKYLVADRGYKTPWIARKILEDGTIPVFPYKSPMTKKGFFKKYEYVYDEDNDCFICPKNGVLKYSTTNRKGYREYKSNPKECADCEYLWKCTESRNHVKLVTRHIWEDYMEKCEDIRHTIGMKDIYAKRKETIERVFGEAKENHGMRYTRYLGKALMQMKVGLTFACINLKKLAKMKRKKGLLKPLYEVLLTILSKIIEGIKKADLEVSL